MTSSMPFPSSLLLNAIAGLSCHPEFTARRKGGTCLRKTEKGKSEGGKREKQEAGEEVEGGSWRRKRRQMTEKAKG